MGTIILKQPIMVKKTIKVEKHPKLEALVCDNCGKIFQMYPFCNDTKLAEMHGTFDKCKFGDGNGFKAIVCSFKCADELFNGGWKNLKEYKKYNKIGAILARVEFMILTAYIKNEQELLEEYNNKIKNKCSNG